MNLQIVEPNLYKDFKGDIIKTMPELIAEGYAPMSIAQIMQRRLEMPDFSKESKDNWWRTSFCARDCIVHNPNGKVKIVRETPLVLQLNPKSNLTSVKGLGMLILPDGAYDALQGLELSKAEAKKYLNIQRGSYDSDQLSYKEVMNNPLWQTVARDNNLLKDYAKFIYAAKDHKRQMGFSAYLDYDFNFSVLNVLSICGFDGQSDSSIGPSPVMYYDLATIVGQKLK